MRLQFLAAVLVGVAGCAKERPPATTTTVKGMTVTVAVDGQPVKTADDFLSLVEAKKPGDKVTLTVIRDGKRLDVPVDLVEAEG